MPTEAANGKCFFRDMKKNTTTDWPYTVWKGFVTICKTHPNPDQAGSIDASSALGSSFGGGLGGASFS